MHRSYLSVALIISIALSGMAQSLERGPYTVHVITENVYRIEDANSNNPPGVVVGDDGQMVSMNNCSDMYLIIGGSKGLLIDLSNRIQWDNTAPESLRTLVDERLEGKQLYIAVTHNHGDHLGMLPVFADDPEATFWIPENEFRGMDIFPEERTHYFAERSSLNLGGGMVVNTLEVPGHTAHSTLYILYGQNLIFSGDALGSGSGVWLFDEQSLYIYKESIDQLITYMEDERNDLDPGKLRIYGGHYWQGKEVGDLTSQYIYDMQTLIKEMEKGTAAMQEMSSFISFLDTNFSYGTATITWNRDAARRLADVTSRPRTIITTDGEVDDMDSFIRMLLYSNELDIEGLVYSSSQWHYKGDGKGTLFTSEMPFTAQRYGERTDLRWPGTTWMQELIDKYARVYDHLVLHDQGYPSPESLRSLIRIGNINFEGEMEEDTEGSDFIKEILMDDEGGPVYVLIWGGTNTLARALKSIEDEYKRTEKWAEVYRKVSEKTIIYAILDQDATYSSYVAPHWPDIRVIYNSAQFWSFAYMWPMVVPPHLKPFMEGEWFSENIKFNHGPLLANYYLWGDGTRIAGDPEHTHGDPGEAVKNNRKQYDFISEGDSPSFFHLLRFGLRSIEDPTFGGLGGRFVVSGTNARRWEDGRNVGDMNPETGEVDPSYPQVRWIKVLQNDFAARADWCVSDYEDANHAPHVTLRSPADITAEAGQTVYLKASVKDPDEDEVKYTWWQYVEAGSCKIPVQIEGADSPDVAVTLPGNATPGQTIHIILEVTDNGSPEITRFARTIVTTE